MKYIVLYALVFLTITLPHGTAQKPAYELLPATHALVHPEALVDTCHSTDSLERITVTGPYEPVLDQDLRKKKTSREENRKRTFNLDSLFRKQNKKKAQASDQTGNHTLYIKKYNPIRLFILITALKI